MLIQAWRRLHTHTHTLFAFHNVPLERKKVYVTILHLKYVFRSRFYRLLPKELMILYEDIPQLNPYEVIFCDFTMYIRKY